MIESAADKLRLSLFFTLFKNSRGFMAKGMVQARKKKARRNSKEEYKNRFLNNPKAKFAPKTWKSKKKKDVLVVTKPSAKNS